MAARYLIGFFVFLVLFKTQIFIVLASFGGWSYEQGADNMLYWQFIVIVWVVAFAFFVFSCFRNPKVARWEVVVYSFIAFLFFAHLVWVSLDGSSTPLFPVLLLQFVLLSLPAVFAARFAAVFLSWRDLIKTSEIFFVAVAVTLTVSHLVPFLVGVRVVGIGGASGQMVAYLAATTFGLVLWHVYFSKDEFRVWVFRSKKARLAESSLLVSMFLVTIINGGRGAFVLLLVFFVIGVWGFLAKRRHSLAGVLRWFAVITMLPILVYLAVPVLERSPVLSAGLERAVAFVDLERDDRLIAWETGTSGRDVVYGRAIEGIKNSPVIGHGPFGHWEKIVYPHNLFLDIALQFGVLIAISFVSILIVMVWRRGRPWTGHNAWLGMLLMSAVVTLMFSGGYLTHAVFWFSIIGLMMKPKRILRHQVANHLEGRVEVMPAASGGRQALDTSRLGVGRSWRT